MKYCIDLNETRKEMCYTFSIACVALDLQATPSHIVFGQKLKKNYRLFLASTSPLPNNIIINKMIN